MGLIIDEDAKQPTLVISVEKPDVGDLVMVNDLSFYEPTLWADAENLTAWNGKTFERGELGVVVRSCRKASTKFGWERDMCLVLCKAGIGWVHAAILSVVDGALDAEDVLG